MVFCLSWHHLLCDSYQGFTSQARAGSKGLNICYSSLRFYGEPLVVSCERTVSVGGGLVKDAGMVFNQRTGCRASLFVCKPAPADLGPGTGHHQGRILGQVLHRAIKNGNIQNKDAALN